MKYRKEKEKIEHKGKTQLFRIKMFRSINFASQNLCVRRRHRIGPKPHLILKHHVCIGGTYRFI